MKSFTYSDLGGMLVGGTALLLMVSYAVILWMKGPLSIDGLPVYVVGQGQRLKLRWYLPRIWTQTEGRAFGIYWSDGARRGVLYPEPTDTELASFYDIAQYNNYLSGTDHRSVDSTVFDRIIVKIAYMFDHSVKDPTPSILKLSNRAATVCDLGCGSGEFLDRIRVKGATVVGVDPSRVSGKSTAARGIEFHAGTAEALPTAIEDRKFDVVTMFQSLEHCRELEACIAECKIDLRPGGLLCVDVPNMDCLGFKLYRQAWFHCDAGRHLQFFTPSSLQRLCSEVGLTPIAIEYDGFTAQYSPLWIQSMKVVWDSIFQKYNGLAPPRPSRAKSAVCLLIAILSPKKLKYDVVRVYAAY